LQDEICQDIRVLVLGNNVPFLCLSTGGEKSVAAIEVTYNGDKQYSVNINGSDKFLVNGASLVKTDNKNLLTCEINGHVTRSNVVIDGDTLHIFTVVSNTLRLLNGQTYSIQ
jgi:hypothetical protein